MRRAIPLILVLALPATAAELPVRSVTLSNAGLIQIERSGSLPPNESITFRAPLDDVDDVLKSLVVTDPAGRLEGIRLPAQDLLAEAFRGLPLRPDDFANRAAMLQALRGHAVQAGDATGRLADAQEVENRGLRVTVITATGLRSVLLADGAEVRLQDAALAERIRRAAEAMAAARTADQRLVEIRLSGAAAAREVGFGYVAGAPLWKPSWRLIIPEGRGDARLLGWAVVENRTGADWDGVRLSLVSGNPAAFHQPLYTPITVERQELPVRAAEQVQVEADTGGRPPPPPMPPPAPAPMAATAASAPAMRALQAQGPAGGLSPNLFRDVAATPSATAASSAGRVAFTLPAPVSVRTGETANLPFLDVTVPAERLWWVQDLAATSPLNAVRIRNSQTSTLPDGIVTVYGTGGAEAGAFLGDAELRAVAPDEARLIAFARDRDVLLSAATARNERPVRVQQRRGVVVVGTAITEEAALAVDTRGARGRMVLDLPRKPGFTPQFPMVAEGDFGLRHEAVLEGPATTLRFVWERASQQELPVWDAGLGDPMVLRWREVDLEQAQRRLPGGPATLEVLRQVLERLPADAAGRGALMATIAALETARQRLEEARTAINIARATEAALARARAAADDRTGPERERARAQLNRASDQAERAGAAADAAWLAWQRAAQTVLAGMG